MRATRVGRLSIQYQTDEREVGTGFGAVAAVWQSRGLGHRLAQRARRLIGALRRQRVAESQPLGSMISDRYVDDLEGERAQLESQGIKTVARTADLCVMEAPGGQRFFVVAPARFDVL